jgi:hypothetical protein
MYTNEIDRTLERSVKIQPGVEAKKLCQWVPASAAVIGSGHEAKNLPCQDYAAGKRRKGATAICLADGAGSAMRSDKGAECCVETVLDYLCDYFDELFSYDKSVIASGILTAVLRELQLMANSVDANIKEFASTLLFAVVKDNKLVAGHLGDGVIGYDQKNSIKVLSHPVRGEFANETIFTTSNGAVDKFKIFKGTIEEVNSFILMSDGSAESLYLRSDSSLAPAVGTFWDWLKSNPASVVEVALHRNLMDLFREQTADDCSVAILKKVSIDMAEFEEHSADFQQEYLDTGNAKGLNNRLKILRAQLADPDISPVELANRTRITLPTVKRHLKTLDELLCLKK